MKSYIRARSNVATSGVLPDGRRFSAASLLTDNGTFAVYSSVKSTSPKGYVAGEFVTANLVKTDLTGELAWTMPVQTSGLHRPGVETVMTVNGSIFANEPAPSGAATLTLSGGNLSAPIIQAANLANGVAPITPVITVLRIKGGILHVSKNVTPGSGKKTGAGIYLPKSNTAWGYFPGTTLGGRIELTQP